MCIMAAAPTWSQSAPSLNSTKSGPAAVFSLQTCAWWGPMVQLQRLAHLNVLLDTTHRVEHTHDAHS